ncbi:MAG: GNAT family N-acetyltransferase [Clostridiales bacterium]|nr:GNAT family N-acetyltransferase [Clostridiales bacterium]
MNVCVRNGNSRHSKSRPKRKARTVGSDKISAGAHFERCAPAFTAYLAKVVEFSTFLCYNYYGFISAEEIIRFDNKLIYERRRNAVQLFYGVPEDIEKWMSLVTQVRWNLPGLETQEKLNEHRTTVLKFMGKSQAVCVKEGNEIAGVMLFSRGHNMICCLAVLPKYRRRGVASMLMEEALANLDRTKEISVSTFRADDEKGTAPRALYEKYGFVADELIEEFDYPNQKYVLHPAGSERKDRQLAVNTLARKISGILSDREPSIYMYGSSVLNDFRLGWSDIDILVLTSKQITEEQAKSLVGLRQAVLAEAPDNPYYRSFEGGMLTLDAFLSKKTDRVVYWGTSGERITDKYAFDSFGMAELTERSVLLYGKDIRKELKYPTFHELYADVKRHYETIRKYAQSTGRSFYSFGWMLDIARCIYTLRTGKIIAKTEAAEWALDNNLCPDPDALGYALKVRRNPLKYKNDKETFDYAETLAEPIQRFADILEKELKYNNRVEESRYE